MFRSVINKIKQGLDKTYGKNPQKQCDMVKSDKKKAIQLHKLTIPKASFDSIPEKERLLFIRFGHALDEINSLQRLFLWSDPTVSGLENAEKNAREAQGFAIARVLTGKLYETYKLIQKCYLKDKGISPKYKKLQSDKIRTTLKNLNRYFSRPNLISKVRNRYAFHYSQDEIVEILRKIPSEDNLVFYLSPDSRNTFFCTADVIIKEAMLKAIESGGTDEATTKLEEETIMITGWMLTFINWFMSTIFRQYLGKDIFEKYGKIAYVSNPPKDFEIQLPYFLSISKDINEYQKNKG